MASTRTPARSIREDSAESSTPYIDSPASPGRSSYLDPTTTATSRPRTSRSRARPRTARPTTAGTTIATQEIICAITESRGVSPTVGLAFVNLSTSEAVLCQICDSQTFARTVHKLAVYAPTEILFATTAKEPTSKLYAIVEENLPDIRIVTIHRKYWSESLGHEYVQALAFEEDINSIEVTLTGNYFATCCLAAVLKYVELELCHSFAFHSLRIKYEPSEGSMMIDLSSIVSLELIQNLQSNRSKECLFGLLNETLTPMGSRLLRSNILQPSTEPEKLTSRYDAVNELGSRQEMFHAVRAALKGFVDSDRVLTMLILLPTQATFQYAEQSINNVVMLKTYVASIKPIFEGLAGANSSLLKAIQDLCSPVKYQEIRDLIDETLNEDVTYTSQPLDLRHQRIYAIKAGVNSLLDVARQVYTEGNRDALTLVTDLTEEHDIQLDLKYDAARQYYIKIPISELKDKQLPAIFINRFSRRNYIECQTLALVKLNSRVSDAHNEVISMSDRSIQDLISDIRSRIAILFKISEGVALLDMLASFAQLMIVQEYVRPELTETLAIKGGRHPIREKIHREKFIPNDVYATKQSRFQIITGCNMSGKSTYIRSVALMTIMAQIGSFVPATYASFPMTHQLFARVSSDDVFEANVSTFSAEMREMAFVLRCIERRSLIIIDELGRGTSTVDGLAIAIAIAEALVDSHALVWFVTHFRELAQIMASRAGVVNLHLAVDMPDPSSKVKMLYKVSNGLYSDKLYGIALARVAALPTAIIERATYVSQKLSEQQEKRKESPETMALVKRRKLILGLREQLLQARDGRMKGPQLKLWLMKLQVQFVENLQRIDRDLEACGNDVEDVTDVADEAASSQPAISEALAIEGGIEDMDSQFDMEIDPAMLTEVEAVNEPVALAAMKD